MSKDGEILKISSLENGSIFTSDFKEMNIDNTIQFSDIKYSRESSSKRGIAVIYGPNGTGKTTLMKTFAENWDTRYEFEYKGTSYKTGDDKIYYLVNDQNNRSNITGNAKDFFLGDNIKEEFDLKEYIETEYKKICDGLVTVLKNDFEIITKNSKLLDLVENLRLKEILSDLANKNSKGNTIKVSYFTDTIEAIDIFKILEYEENKFAFFKKDLGSSSSIVEKILRIQCDTIKKNERVKEIEENEQAIKILTRFPDMSQCIVCDNSEIEVAKLLERKETNKENVIKSLDDNVKGLIEEVLKETIKVDPFEIKERLLKTIETGDADIIKELQDNFQHYKSVFKGKLYYMMHQCLNGSQLAEKNRRYEELVANKLSIQDEDFLFIKEIIKGIGKALEVDRDGERAIRIYLGNDELTNKERHELPLSAGEQNFLSLTFEFLKAEKSEAEIVILDDPISSFDSIYKNKIAFSIVKMLEKQQRMVLTHNIDLIRLLEGQYKGCFNLYLLNNTDGERNGFIKINQKEQLMLINLKELISEFRKSILDKIGDKNTFLISMIPFMRGYAEIVGNKLIEDRLTQVMHGYKNEGIDIAAHYRKLFGIPSKSKKLPKSLVVNVDDIIEKVSGCNSDIVDAGIYPLLNHTLKHTLNYLYLRLLVEKTLVNKYRINVDLHKQLGQIIFQAFPGDSDEEIKNRVFLTSKKTLLNEFNHFEGNLSIFQPAIDITNSVLEDEMREIKDFVYSLND